MIKAVLFDLDDTLLDINLTAFAARYVAGRAALLARACRQPFPKVFSELSKSYLALDNPGRNDSFTNEQFIQERMLLNCDIPLDEPHIADALAYFDSEYVRRFDRGLVQARPKQGNHAALAAVQSLGLSVALATQPIFPLSTVRVRMSWAEIDNVNFAAISHAGNSTRTKPSARYYQEFCAKLGLSPHECLMVGNDATRDFARPACGLRTAYVGHAWPKKAVFRGNLDQFAKRLPEIIALLNAQDKQDDTI